MGSGIFVCSVARWLDRSGSLDGRLVRRRVGLLTNCYDDENELPEKAIKFTYNELEGWCFTSCHNEVKEGIFVDFKTLK